MVDIETFQCSKVGSRSVAKREPYHYYTAAEDEFQTNEPLTVNRFAFPFGTRLYSHTLTIRCIEFRKDESPLFYQFFELFEIDLC
jgi:hypothetical protein